MWWLLVAARVETIPVTEWLGWKEWVDVLRLVEMVASILWTHSWMEMTPAIDLWWIVPVCHYPRTLHPSPPQRKVR